MLMYVANVTQQTQDFIYRLPEHQSPLRQEIKVGEQIRVAANLTSDSVTAIAEQHACYGMARAADVSKREVHTSLIYSTDKPITEAQMRAAWERNLAIMENRGRELRADAAVHVNNVLREENDAFRAVELSVVEERSDGGRPVVNDRVTVDSRKADTTGRRRRAA